MQISELNEQKLPPAVAAAFIKLAHDQRGEPERAMLRVQRLMGGGVLNPVVEHVGDLTHRMTEHADQGNFLWGIVEDKVNKTFGWLTNGYGFRREYLENIQNNAKYKSGQDEQLSSEQLREKLQIALRAYADAHRQLVVYNFLQWLARQAAIYVGLEKFESAAEALKRLKKYTDNKDKYIQAVSAYDLNGAGQPMPFQVMQRDPS